MGAAGELELEPVGFLALRDIAVGVVAIINSRMAVDGDSLSSESTLGATEQALLQRTYYQRLIKLLSNVQQLHTLIDIPPHVQKQSTNNTRTCSISPAMSGSVSTILTSSSA